MPIKPSTRDSAKPLRQAVADWSEGGQ